MDVKLPQNSKIARTSVSQEKSTSEAVLTQLQDLHPLPGIVLQYRQVSMERSQYRQVSILDKSQYRQVSMDRSQCRQVNMNEPQYEQVTRYVSELAGVSDCHTSVVCSVV